MGVLAAFNLHVLGNQGPVAAVQIGAERGGKPFSLDNLRSASVASVCSSNGLAELGIVPSSMRTIVPSYLRPR